MVSWLRTSCTLCLLLVGTAGPVLAFQAEVRRYYDLVGNICRTGVTEEIIAAYNEARIAVDRAQYGGGRDNNFWGLKSPGRFYQDCFQSPGTIR